MRLNKYLRYNYSQILNSINKINKKTKIKFVADRPGHDFRYALDNRKILKELKWRPKINFDQGLASTIKWYFSNKKFLKQISKKKYVKRLGLKI